ncbi:hypothetical protein EY04_27810 [Pseudomonas chlororaphis]|nr:hypothetical protein EY04_27810 [Pseudomonas chlororaphis]
MERFLMESIAKLIVIIGLGYLIMTCSTTHNTASTKSRAMDRSHSPIDQRPNIRFTQLKRVGRAFNASGQPTAYILLGSEDGDLLDIYLMRSAIKNGYSFQSHGLNPAQVELRAHWKGIRFSQSDAYSTLVNLSIESLTPTEAVINVSATLVHSTTGAYLEVASSKISITGEQLNELIGGYQVLP